VTSVHADELDGDAVPCARRLCKLTAFTDGLIDGGCPEGAVIVASIAGCDDDACWLATDVRPCTALTAYDACAYGAHR
jgi:hypothetical protein